MADIFVSYARPDRMRVAPLISALEAMGWSVWWDPAMIGGEEFDVHIMREIEAARAAIVVWTPVSVGSRWVRGEARFAADRGILVPVQFDSPSLPLDARALHTITLDDWMEDSQSPPFQTLVRALGGHLGTSSPAAAPAMSIGRPEGGVSICVLPFTNMSLDPEQDYFSDGITEDIITDLSKVSALSVVARNNAFTFKDRPVDIPAISRQLKVTHVLEGSVRKSGDRVRINAQLIDGKSGTHIWAERYDRDFNDIFHLQDEISNAIVTALKVKLLPEEKQAIEKRGTTNPEAYQLYLMARQYEVKESRRYFSVIVRLLHRATEIDPNYALAWAKLARAQVTLRAFGPDAETGETAARRALELDPALAEAHSTMAIILSFRDLIDDANRECEIALRLDPESWEVNDAAAHLALQTHRFADAAHFYEKSAALMESDFAALSMATQAYQALGDREGAVSAARRSLKRIEKEIAKEPDNGSALGHGATLLALLGEVDSAKNWAARAVLVDPDNTYLSYNLACTMLTLNDVDAALNYLESYFSSTQREGLAWAKQDTDLDPIRTHPRFAAMIAATEARLAGAQ